ncbi:AMP-binding protein [Sphingorhabdus arenilitoris]|uniref:AMP-binding protein n=1 Tax=Sphingorhabdus arenilitoris TaxID=1490041 RepID=A0ABV8RGU3_9SPHN
MSLHPGTIAAQAPDREALVFGEQRWTYSKLNNWSAALAALLFHNGFKQGDVLALLISNRAEFLGAAWAAQRSGLYYLPIPTRLTASEIRYILSDSGAKALVVDGAFIKVSEEAAAGLDLLTLPLDGIEEQFGNYAAPPAVEGGDMLYTSGTTGKPKGVRRQLSFEPLGSDSRRVERGEKLFGFSQDTIFLSPAPLYHAAPLRFAMNLLRCGAKIVAMQRFDAEATLSIIDQEHITHSQWVPTMFSRLLALPSDVRDKQRLTSHQVAIHAGAPCPPAVKRDMITWWGPILHEYYSGTESVGFTHINSPEWLERPGSVGRPHGCKVHIVDDTGAEVGPGEIGNVYFEGKARLSYHGDTAKTLLAHNAQGWATMGDIGYVDADGYLFLTDRKNFTVISGGVNIYPSEVEAALMAHPAVADCAVFGIPDTDLGEAVAAIIETNSAGEGASLAQHIVGDARARISAHKLPRFIRFDAVGRSETGKIAKQALKERFADIHHWLAVPKSDGKQPAM